MITFCYSYCGKSNSFDRANYHYRNSHCSPYYFSDIANMIGGSSIIELIGIKIKSQIEKKKELRFIATTMFFQNLFFV